MPLPNVQPHGLGYLALLDGTSAAKPLVLPQQVRVLWPWPRGVFVCTPRRPGDQQRRGPHRAGVQPPLQARDFLFEERTGSHGFLLG